MKTKGVFSLMRNLIAILLFLVLTAHACKDPKSDTNPQLDDQEFSTLFLGGVEESELQIPDLEEASGLVNSRSNSSFLWSHNDSGDTPTLYLFTKNGADSGRYQLNGAQNIDWEDLAIGPGPDDNVDYLYVGDIGDNRAVRESLTIYRVPEPDVSIRFRQNNLGDPVQIDLPADSTLMQVERINFEYEDGSRDAEALFVEPSSKDIYIITKREPSVILYKIPYPQSTSEMNTAQRVMVLPFTFITAADISPSGNELLIKNYMNVYHWQRNGNETLQEMLSKQPNRLRYNPEPQGEAIAWDNDESSFYTVSESDGSNPVVLLRYTRN